MSAIKAGAAMHTFPEGWSSASIRNRPDLTFDDLVFRTDGCWWWRGSFHVTGYGVFYRARPRQMAHRYSWERANAQTIPNGLLICHHCDNRACVRPHHLFLGTYKDNHDDMASKGRARRITPRGEKNHQSVLTADNVREIRAMRGIKTGVEIARQYGVTPACISEIFRGRTWSHVPPLPDSVETKEALTA